LNDVSHLDESRIEGLVRRIARGRWVSRMI
jgi:hypothetical protein